MEEKFTSLNLTLNECKEKHLCPVCGKEAKRISKSNWNLFCSQLCCKSVDGKRIIAKMRRQTILKRYGVDNISKLEEIKQKKKKTTIEHFGGFTFEVKELAQKAKQTCVERYGAENPFASEIVKEKIKKTNLEKYGCENPNGCKEIREKITETFRERKYNEFIKSLKERGFEALFSIDEYVSAIPNDTLKFKCIDCGKINEYHYKEDWGISIGRFYCSNPIHKINSTSQYEQEIHDWLKSLGIENIERNKRDWNREKVFEADIFLPNYNLAIEYNGLYWHSNLNKDDDYHYNKWKFFKDMNIQCIQIFENEWRDNKEVVKNIIMDKLNLLQPLNEKNYYLDFVGDNEFNSFLQQNSLFKNKKSDNKLGIYTSDKILIQVLSYSILDNKILIDNFCTKLGIKFAEGLKAFTNYLKRTCNKDIYIEIDCRHYSNKEFEGFEFVEHTEPKCYYFRNTENILYENKVGEECLKIYDCGNDILIFKIN